MDKSREEIWECHYGVGEHLIGAHWIIFSHFLLEAALLLLESIEWLLLMGLAIAITVVSFVDSFANLLVF